ncbi:probable bifunctional dTTP/UTP pyrophosphatase/methyltransferase protein [Leucoraja erinacea]|uniref:probable bifunctional dTTP/UTP pyrophosphatase/methyltransferase protein n=1 Tax=Leucoraja erinaceus TaxID=7782 RepID=UPI002455D4BA|nr:probable bifunctional dTTP/UTP pyrophosphatase/methyltransferase protein [Leucoraja erinacea]
MMTFNMVTLVVPGNQLETNVTLFHEETKVKFSELSEELLWDHSFVSRDKAGGYGIQALGGMLVEYVHVDFLNVVGFPLNHFCKKLAEINSSLESQSTASNATFSGSVNQDKMMDAEKGLKSDQTTPMEAKPKGLGATPQIATTEARESEVPDSLPRTSGHVEMNEGLLKVADLVYGFKVSKVPKLHCEQNRLKTTVDGTEPLLDACVSLGLVDKTPGTSQFPGNIFTDDIPQAELDILGHVWKEDKIDLLLSKLSHRCKPGCGLLLTEIVLYDRKTKPCRALLQNLGLMMESEGKERSGSEYRKLLHNHGFTNVHIKHTGTILDVIFCTKQ